MIERNCTNCRHFERAKSETEEALDFGECRFYPPVMLVLNDEPTSMFPIVDELSVCGQYKAAQ